MKLSPTEILVAALNAASVGFDLALQPKVAALFSTLANAAQAGANIDAHMEAVAEKLKAGPVTDADWSDVTARIEADSDRLQGA